MKKKILFTLFCGIIVLGFTSCGIKTTIKENAELNEADGVSMTIKKGTLTRKSATVVISDTNGKEANIYGSDFRVDKKENEEWKEVEKSHNDYAFNDMAYYVDDEGKLEFVCNWEYMYGKLENGEYRIVKYTFPNTVTYPDRTITESDKLYFSVEFIIDD